MVAKKILFCLACGFALAGTTYAAPTAITGTGAISLSAYAHTIQQGADAGSQVFETDFGITPVLGITAELAKVRDADGNTDIGSVYARKPIERLSSDRTHIAGYAGITWIAVKDRFGDKSEKTGPLVGAIADFTIRPELTFYSRAGVAFLEKPLWTIDVGLRYELRPKLFLSLGYRSFDVDGSSLGGFLAGMTYKF